jgi:hypothetical protein
MIGAPDNGSEATSGTESRNGGDYLTLDESSSGRMNNASSPFARKIEMSIQGLWEIV